MTSQIEFQGVDSEFPVAGQDNDTQGFRDNFSIIKNALGTAQSEITELQDSTVKLNETSNFQGTTLIDANFEQSTATAFSGTISDDVSVSFLNGHYQKFNVNLEGSTANLTLTDWPVNVGSQNRYASMRIQLAMPEPESGTSSEVKTINWFVEGGGTILADETWPQPFTLDTLVNYIPNSEADTDSTVKGPIVVEFWSYNGGDTIFAKYLGSFSAI